VASIRLSISSYNTSCPGAAWVRSMPAVAELQVWGANGTNLALTTAGASVSPDSGNTDNGNCGCRANDAANAAQWAARAFDNSTASEWMAAGSLGGCKVCQPCTAAPWLISVLGGAPQVIRSVALLGSDSGGGGGAAPWPLRRDNEPAACVSRK
jgi:hypothetical protein